MSPEKKQIFIYERALKARAAGFLQKPFNDQALVDLIKVAFKKEEEYA